MTGIGLDDGRSGTRSHCPLRVRGNHPILGRDEVPAWLVSPCGLADLPAECIDAPRDLRGSHERRFVGIDVACERGWELLLIKKEKPIDRWQDRWNWRAGRWVCDKRVH